MRRRSVGGRALPLTLPPVQAEAVAEQRALARVPGETVVHVTEDGTVETNYDEGVPRLTRGQEEKSERHGELWRADT